MQEKITTKVDMQLNNLYVVLLVFLLGLVGLGVYFVYNSQQNRTITVSGKSSTTMVNEIATFSVTAESTNADKQTAVQDVSNRSQEIVAALKQFGIADKDIQTANLNVYQIQQPVLENGVTVYKPGDWYASYMVNITLRDPTRSTELTSLIAGFDSTSISGPNLQIDEENVDEAALLQAAIINARSKAEAMAVKAGKRIGGVVSISESNPNSNPVVFMNAAQATGLGGGGGFPIEAGATKVQKYVIVTYWLR